VSLCRAEHGRVRQCGYHARGTQGLKKFSAGHWEFIHHFIYPFEDFVQLGYRIGCTGL
jgi:hypothetical protein